MSRFESDTLPTFLDPFPLQPKELPQCRHCMADPRKVLLYDVETVFNVIAKFDLREEFTRHENIIQERYIACAAWRWLGDKRTSAVSVLDDPKRYKKAPHDDYHVVDTLRGLMEQADLIVGHNVRKFDNRWVNGRMLYHGLAPLPPIKVVDTLTVARSVFYLNSNRLDYLGKYLGFGGKTETKSGLWLEVLKGNPQAVKDMVAYNKRDVELLEQVYRKLWPFIPSHFNQQLYVVGDGCPHCSAKDNQMHSRGTYRANVLTYRRWRCQSCTKWARSRKADPR